MKNKLTDLNNHLFAQLERLGDEDTIGEKLDEEISRSKAITGISKEIVGNARLVLDAQKFKVEAGLIASNSMPEMLEHK